MTIKATEELTGMEAVSRYAAHLFRPGAMEAFADMLADPGAGRYRRGNQDVVRHRRTRQAGAGHR